MRKEKAIGHRILAVLLTLAGFLTGGIRVSAAGENGMAWYCKRAEGHIQPPTDAALAEVEAHGGYYIDHKHTDPNAQDKVVYLTFDAGYENGNVAKVVDALDAAGATGAFFILGHLAESHPDLVRRMADGGHLVCNHTYSHKNLVGVPGALEGELKRLEDTVMETAGVRVATYFRPPEGKFDMALLDEASGLGYRTVFWSFAYADWDNKDQPNPAAAKEKILKHLHNGAVILLHPTSATNAAIMPELLAEMRAQGYRFGTLDELTGAPSPEPRCVVIS